MMWPFRRRRLPAALESMEIGAARYVVLDTELTSLDAKSNRLLSAGAIGMRGGRIELSEQFYRVVNPGVETPAATVAIHGLRPADIASAEPVARVLEELAGFVGDAILVGHFVRIDVDALRKERPAGFLNASICTARTWRWLLRTSPLTDEVLRGLDHLDLDSVARAHSLEPKDSHHALGDAYLTAQIWQRMMPQLVTRGVTTLGHLRKSGILELS